MFENDYLMHHGIKGQKWGVRRYQNTDGSWTAAGRARYSKGGGSRARYGSENPIDERTRRKVEKLNKRIDAENTYYQRSHAGRQAITDTKTGRSALSAGLKVGLAEAAIAGGVGGAITEGDIKQKLKNAAIAGGAFGLAAGGGAAGGTVLGSRLGKHVIKKEGPTNKAGERHIQGLVAERNALDPSQKNRKGRVLTKEEYSKVYNEAMNSLGYTRKHKGLVSDEQYNKYLRETVAYGSNKKNAKYGARLNAHDRNRVAMLNDEIDALNYDYQRSHAGAKAALASKPKAYAKLEAAKLAYPGALAGLGIGGAIGTYMSSPKQAALAFGGGTLIGALGGAAIGSHSATKKFKKEIKSFKDEPYDPEIKRELNSLIAERNYLDPSQKNRKGRVITKEEYSDAYNLGRNMLEGGNKHKGLVSDEIYNDYLKNTTTYGSKKKRR